MNSTTRRGGNSSGRTIFSFLAGISVSAIVLYTCFLTGPAHTRQRAAPLRRPYSTLEGEKRAPRERVLKERAVASLPAQEADEQHGYVKPFVVPEKRAHIADLLQKEGMKIGAELGVQTGRFANETLTGWTGCERYYLVDLWRKMPSNYDDLGNADDTIQSSHYWNTRERLKWAAKRTKLTFLSMFTVEAADLFPDGYFDYVYVDARHDYCGVMDDLNAWWPKLREGGIAAGHDYVFAHEVHGQDWSLCEDGSRNPGAVKGAVMEFALQHNLKVEAIFKNEQPSWIMRKPVYGPAKQ